MNKNLLKQIGGEIYEDVISSGNIQRDNIKVKVKENRYSLQIINNISNEYKQHIITTLEKSLANYADVVITLTYNIYKKNVITKRFNEQVITKLDKYDNIIINYDGKRGCISVKCEIVRKS